jgi:hypothetical protein
MGILDKANQMAAQVKATVDAQRRELEGRQQQAVVQQHQAQQAAEQYRQWLLSQGKLVEYKVATVRETLVGDKIAHSQLETLLNQYASAGWTLKSLTKASVGGRVGPGGVDGLIVVFERPLMPNG